MENTEEQKQELEWWETFDGILVKIKELKEENEALKAEVEKLRKPKRGRPKKNENKND